MDSIETQLTQLNTIKSDIKAAIVAKGVSGVTDDFKTYASKIQSITTGGSSSKKTVQQLLIEEGACLVIVDDDGTSLINAVSLNDIAEADVDFATGAALLIYNEGVVFMINIVTTWFYTETTRKDYASDINKIQDGTNVYHHINLELNDMYDYAKIQPVSIGGVQYGSLTYHHITHAEMQAFSNCKSSHAKNIMSQWKKDNATVTAFASPYYNKSKSYFYIITQFGSFPTAPIPGQISLTNTSTTKVGLFLVGSVPEEWLYYQF